MSKLGRLCQDHDPMNPVECLARDVLSARKHRDGNFSDIADQTGILLRKVPRQMQLLASTWAEVQRCQRRQLEENLARLPSDDLLLFLDLSNYDETPMPVVARDVGTQHEL